MQLVTRYRAATQITEDVRQKAPHLQAAGQCTTGTGSDLKADVRVQAL